ncbi:hypothetical protein Tco_1509346 [Tanacetum coccineum]
MGGVSNDMLGPLVRTYLYCTWPVSSELSINLARRYLFITRPLPYGFAKANYDVAWLPSSKEAGLGFVVRNSKAGVILSGVTHDTKNDL